jgi:hypothetical protein
MADMPSAARTLGPDTAPPCANIRAVARGARDAQLHGMPRKPTHLDVAFTSAMLELGRLRDNIDFAEWCRHIRAVDTALCRLCDAIDDPRAHDHPSADRLARDAYISVLALAQTLHGAYSDDARTQHALELTGLAVGKLLDALEPYVAEEARSLRFAIGREPIDVAVYRALTS